ncbi:MULTISPECIES: sugar ABC transporter substrate-binding protein [Pseudomonas]|jgi:sorbitol/mannitol transport system substrate-binding protein|uniref:Sugar ABC transporter substrate-binding protein n=1 Tax=Pseudomonas fluorescens TaxID=294 RepID=A0A5E7PYU2_PSEFL|nr:MULTISPECIES: sugar ABC transporter substrate-binding protein [Pseudomonas]KPG96075.1 sugar ABC transporter substrate-binding protein [Pseudomonas sp. RIT-PI-r]MCF5704659.1 extracellular solute-binding protein [Pseudomonas syringae]MCP1488400.1 sorbitol/mannitol transport system substrate-binding protein [Pseudomonas fluorescens]PRB50862.1 sugar ABC transporter substrate-binding protein [Pseudomonas sp. MYb3]PRC34240.1 sugar ABC transporter substrate-binding protein [Pseudomonas sp. MYb2]
MQPTAKALLALTCMTLSSVSLGAQTLTIATVNNSDMIRMQKLSKTFETEHPDIKLNWVVLEENVLRQRLTTDIATQGGQFDVLTIGMYEAALWGAKGWLEPMKDLPASYALDDVFPSVREGLSVKGSLYALPFYAESSITYYRTDLFKDAGLTMPERPTWEQIAGFAEKLTKKDKEQYGICLRGKAGWGENMALITTVANAYGARWFDEKWQPEFNGPEWKNALNFYVDTMKKSGPPGASSNGFNENLALFNSGKCAMWVDASVAGSFVTDKTQSKVADHVGFTFAPHQVTDKGSAWLYSWALAIPTSSKAKDAAKEFSAWATSKEYGELVAKTDGIANVPPGTRASTYSDAYMSAAPFAKVTLESLKAADPGKPTLKPVPYIGIQLVTIPEFQAVGTQVGKLFSAALIGQTTVDQALAAAQQSTEREMKRAGYPK